MIFKKKGNREKEDVNISDMKSIEDVHSELIDDTEVLELTDVDDTIKIDINFEDEYESIEIDESVDLEEISDDSSSGEIVPEDVENSEDTEITFEEADVELTIEEASVDVSDDDGLAIEDVSAEPDSDLSDEIDVVSLEDVEAASAPNFAKRWALVLSMAAASVVIGVSSVAIVTVRQKKATTAVVNAATTEETSTERFLLLTDDYKNIEYKNITLEILPEDTTITVNILDSESQPYKGVLFKAVAVKGTVDDNREFLNDVVTHEQVEDFDTSDTVPFTQVNDDDLDGTIVFGNLEEADYTIALLAASGYNPVEPVEVSTIKYDIIENIIEQVAAESAETIKEDPENDRNIAVETPATTAAVTAASTTAAAKQVEVSSVKTVDGEIVYNVSYGGTRELSESELAEYPWVEVYVSSGDSYSVQSGYELSTGSKTVGEKKVSYTSQILVPVDDVNVSVIDGMQFSIMQDADTEQSNGANKDNTADSSTSASNTDLSNGSNTENGGDNSSEKQSQQGNAGENSSDSSNGSTTTAPSGSTTTAPSGSTTTAPSGSTTTTPSATQPTTSVAAKKTYRIVNLEPVVESEKKTVYGDGWHTDDGKTYYYKDGTAYTGWHEIDGIQYYFDSKGVLSSKTVIDVSRFNGTIDWSAVKAAGIDYAIIRVGYRGYGSGTLTWDSTFDTNMKGAIAAGIKVGAYIVTQAINTSEAVEEASFIVNACSKYTISLPLVIDVETAGGGTGRGDKISVSTRTAVINAFAQTVKNAGYTPMVYASKSWLEGKINSGSISSYCKVWIARYNDTLGYSGRYSMWQFRSDGSVNGISGNVDVSAWIN